MSPIEIHPIVKPVHIHVSGNKITLPNPLRQKIDQYWQQLIKEKTRLHNGEAFTVVAVNDTDDNLDIELTETDYAHNLYSHQAGGLGEYTVRIIHSATLVITADNKLVFGAMGIHTSRPGIIQCCGGGIDHDDITNGIVDIEHNTVKELGEELGLNAYDKDIANDFSPKYLKTGGPTGKMTLVYVMRITLTATQFLKHYEEFVKDLKANNEEPEFGQIFCIDNNEKTIETFIAKHNDKLNEFMPVLLRAAASAE